MTLRHSPGSHGCSPSTPPALTQPSRPNCPMSPSLQPLVTPRELATVTASLAVFPPLLETFTGKALAQENDSNGEF